MTTTLFPFFFPAAVYRRLTAMLCRSLLLGLLFTGCQSPHWYLTQEQIEILRGAGFHEEGDTWGINLDGRILFGNNEAVLSEKNRETIARVVKTLKEIGIEHLVVEGHADSTGDKRYNQDLSLRRAKAVAREVARNGLPYRNISIKGYGTSQPIYDNATRQGRAQNRRVVLIVPTE
ncbi:MAG: OmpA family protein [Azoarcus sp.]|jgi:outer membrane protein OmpA-like peptidoglycan-associated protein|nr:OmpA family protein [Azoarcus sp.]